MKRNFILIFTVAAITGAAGWNVSQNMSEKALSDVTLANVEALADEYCDKKWEKYYRPDGTGYNCSPTGNESCYC
jgi:hypothetical protein